MTNQQGAPEALRFTQKPVTIDAWLIDFGNKPLPDWVNEAFRAEAIDWCPAGEGLYIKTLEGNMLGANGSWLIKGVQGELYACKPDIFAATYERAVTHVQKPAEIEHVANDVSKNGAELDMAQQPAPSAAADWKLVPEGPTPDMVRAGWELLPSATGDRWDAGAVMARSIYSAMLAAAPQPSPTPQADSQPAPSIDDLCARIKAADDAAADKDYMLDSNDCIAVLRGQWKGPMAMDKPDRAARAPADSGAAPAVGAVTGPTSDLHPEKCPITGRPFFMTLDHPELGRVPTYGGPYDSYTIPAPEGEPTDPWHERELRSERYDHDAGWWVEGGEPIPLRIVHEDVLFKLQEGAEAAAAHTPPTQAADSGAAPAGGAVAMPSDDIDAVGLARYKVVPAHESMFHRFAVVAGDGKQQLYLGREVECENMARKFAGAFLDGAFYQSQLAAAPTPPAPADSVLEDAAPDIDAAFEAVRRGLCKIPRYSFALDSRGNLRRCEDKSGNWIEFDAAHALFDPVAVDAARKQGGA